MENGKWRTVHSPRAKKYQNATTSTTLQALPMPRGILVMVNVINTMDIAPMAKTARKEGN
tara:strand:+ start:461 stop:640 length:180 start_codon:yes stop_codon:yes gene_type:complete